jgi:N-acetyl-1-D-myo-inositol-2-amino-2-deoxy-alpha-D-glucopyranoside deacetylase
MVVAERRLLLVHAHPDDESIGTGATMARYAAEGVRVTLVTCTLGELGEVIPPSLAHLAAGRENRLGEYRIGELAAACAALGVSDHRFLGGPGRWRDSGMMGLPDNDDPRCFWRASVDEAAAELTAVIREVRPQVVVTYDSNGFYGHPDHIQAHRVSRQACELAAAPAGRDPAWQVAKFYATAMPRSVLAAAIRLGPDRPAGFRQAAPVDALPFGVPDDRVTTEIDGTAYLAAKIAALRAHATQVAVHPPYFALSDLVGQRISGREYFTLLAGPGSGDAVPAGPGSGDALPAGPGSGDAVPAGPGSGDAVPAGPGRRPAVPAGREQDLFAGL